MILFFTFAIFSRRVHDLDNLGHGQLPRLPAGQLPNQIPSGSSLLHLLPILLHGHPHDHTGCNLFLFLLREFLFSRQLPQDRIQTRFFSLQVTTTWRLGFTTTQLHSPRYCWHIKKHDFYPLQFPSSIPNILLSRLNQLRTPRTRR